MAQPFLGTGGAPRATRAYSFMRDLDDTGTTRNGEACSLRSIYVYMIEEDARHNGHADLIRELVGGTVGL